MLIAWGHSILNEIVREIVVNYTHNKFNNKENLSKFIDDFELVRITRDKEFSGINYTEIEIKFMPKSDDFLDVFSE